MKYEEIYALTTATEHAVNTYLTTMTALAPKIHAWVKAHGEFPKDVQDRLQTTWESIDKAMPEEEPNV